MTTSEKAAIDASFPPEVPVVRGVVQSGKAQGPDAWDYSLMSYEEPASVAEWYRQAYRGRSWELVSDRALETGEAELTFQKGGAQSRLTIGRQAGATRVDAIVGVGAPVLETQ